MAAPVVDSTFNGIWTGGTSHGIAYTSAGYSSELFMLVLNYEPNSSTPVSVSSITDTSGLTWTKYNGHSVVAASPATYDGVEVWYAFGTVPASGTLTVNMSGTVDDVSYCGLYVSGVNGTRPFDRNAALPSKYSTAVPDTSSMTVSTSTANVLVIAATGSPHNTLTGNLAVTFGGAAFDADVASANFGGANWSMLEVNWKAYTSIQTGLALVGVSSQDSQAALAFALTADSQPVLPPTASAYLVG